MAVLTSDRLNRPPQNYTGMAPAVASASGVAPKVPAAKPAPVNDTDSFGLPGTNPLAPVNQATGDRTSPEAIAAQTKASNENAAADPARIAQDDASATLARTNRPGLIPGSTALDPTPGARPKTTPFLDQVASVAGNPIVNPIGYAGKKVGNAIDNALGVNVSGYVQDPAGQALNDLGAPDAIQAIGNPTGFLTRTGVNPGTGYGTNVPQIGANAIDAKGNIVKDVGAAVDVAKAVPGAVSDAAGAVGDFASDAAGAIGDFFGGFGVSNRTGGGGLGTGSNDALAAAEGQAQEAKTIGRGVLGGGIAPGGAGEGAQQDALDQAMGFANGPRAVTGALGDAQGFANGPRATDAAAGDVNAYRQGPRAQDSTIAGLDSFLGQPEGPSKAQLLLDEASQGAMSDVLSASRSGRARDAGSQARQSAVAQGEIAGMGVDNARNAGLLRAQESDDFRKQQLAGLGQKGQLAQGVDQGTLESLGLGSTLAAGRDKDTLGGLNLAGDLSQAYDKDTLASLGLGGDLATSMRGANVDERGQTLNFAQGMEGLGTGLQGDVLKTIPQLEQVRHDDEYELTPAEKMKLAKIGAVGGLGAAIIPKLLGG